MQDDIFLARQPVFNIHNEVCGYELLFRSNAGSSANVTDGNQATTSVFLNSFLEIGLDRITGGKTAFINLSQKYIVGDIDIPIPSDNVVLEILEDIRVDSALVNGVKTLSQRGYKIALDDFVLTDTNAKLVPYASIVKVDILAMDEKQLIEQVGKLSRFPVKLLAEKVETHAQHQLCRELGFDYFQGYFFAQPAIVSSRQLPANRLAMLELMSKIQSPECDLAQLETIIRQDLGLSLKLLKLINSSFYGLSRKVESIQHAVKLLGLDTLRKWLTVMSLALATDKSPELITLALLRAKMCEQLAGLYDCNRESAFTVGLFSMLDAIADQPLDELLPRLPLSDNISSALLYRTGNLGRLLGDVDCYEKGIPPKNPCTAGKEKQRSAACLNALLWSADASHSVV